MSLTGITLYTPAQAVGRVQPIYPLGRFVSVRRDVDDLVHEYDHLVHPFNRMAWFCSEHIPVPPTHGYVPEPGLALKIAPMGLGLDLGLAPPTVLTEGFSLLVKSHKGLFSYGSSVTMTNTARGHRYPSTWSYTTAQSQT